jgi:hypothetical protein
MNLDLSRQPAKGLVFTLASIPVAFGLWFLLIRVFGLAYGAGTLVFTVCFTYFWQHGWSFQGWPAHLWTKSRWIQGVINWILLMLTVWLTIVIWATISGKPFYETQLGLWAQTTIIAAVISLFFFGNQLLLPASLANKQPLAGFTNLVWAVLFFPTALLFLPSIWGAPPAYIPWIWFPVALVPMAYFGGWPFDRLGQPRAGIAYAGVTFFLTFAMLVLLNLVGIGFFAPGDPGLKAAIFGATWTNVGLLLAWLFNMWPIGTMPRPLKGIVGTVGTILVSLAVYSLIIQAVSAADLATVLFIEFAYMWAQVSFAAVGLFNVFQWGYADDPLGAGVERLRLLARAAKEEGEVQVPSG